MSRPIEYTDEVIKQICSDMEDYTQKTPIPKFAEFCFEKELCREYLYELAHKNKELSYNIKRLFLKKETALEEKLYSATNNHTGEIFALKQLGWSDRQFSENLNYNTDSDEKFLEMQKKLREEINSGNA